MKKHNPVLPQIFPRLYRISAGRELNQLQNDILMFQEDEQLQKIRSGCRIFGGGAKQCRHCFQCIGLIGRKNPVELTAVETARLLEYKLYQLNLNDFSRKVNENFQKNGGHEKLRYVLKPNRELFVAEAAALNPHQNQRRPVESMGKGMKSIYMLSLLETYIGEPNRIPSVIMVEDPEIYLHPQLQKLCAEPLYRLSKKNQVIFKTHAPVMLFNFSIRQIRQVVLDGERFSVTWPRADIGPILDGLGYGANDWMNAGVVFIVEGKQDKSRLPLLLKRYYSEVYDGEGKDAGELCSYYEQRKREDGELPRVTRKNVLILKYYSFENYFLNPQVMARLGVVESPEAFYETLFAKRREYLHRLSSGQQLMEVMGRNQDGE